MIKVKNIGWVAALAALVLASCSNPLMMGTAGGTDLNDGAEARAYASVNPSMYLRGTNNSWGLTAMSLTADNCWTAVVRFYASSGNAFKFDAYGNWSKNWGDNGGDGRLDPNGANIAIGRPQAYRITFFERNLSYAVIPLADVQVYFKHLQGEASTMSGEVRGLQVSVYRDGARLFNADGSPFVITGGGYAQPAAELRLSNMEPGQYRLVVDGIQDWSNSYFSYGLRRYAGELSFSLDGAPTYWYGTMEVNSVATPEGLTVHYREWEPASAYGVQFSGGNLYTMGYEGFINGRHWWVACFNDADDAQSLSFRNSNGGTDTGARNWTRAAQGEEIFIQAFDNQIYAVRP